MDEIKSVKAEKPENNAEDRIKAALDTAFQYGQVDGAHHKAWVIDQMVRCLLGDDYEKFVEKYQEPFDGDYYEWDEGIAP